MPRVFWKAALAAAVVILVTVAGGAVAKGAGRVSTQSRFVKDRSVALCVGRRRRRVRATSSPEQQDGHAKSSIQLGGARCWPYAVR